MMRNFSKLPVEFQKHVLEKKCKLLCFLDPFTPTSD